VWLQAIIDADARADGVPPWLRDGEPVAAEGRIESARCLSGGELRVNVRVSIGGRAVPLSGAGRIRQDGETLEAVGVTVIDPRTLGFALPPLVTYVLHTRWVLILRPA
jgi:hypothetical protein